jgi:hypothetical protein
MKTALQRVAISVIAMFLLQAFTYAADITTADALLRAMHDRYTNTWYDTLTFTQRSTTYNADGTTKVEAWYEAALLPGKLRIDIGPPADGHAYLMVDGNATIFEKGKDPRSRPLVNLLLVLGFDVYKQSPETTLKIVQSQKIDISKFHEETWEGRPVYVVGAGQPSRHRRHPLRRLPAPGRHLDRRTRRNLERRKTHLHRGLLRH